MAKKKPDYMSGVFTKTEKPQAEPDVVDTVRSRGVALKTSEWQAVDQWADRLGMSPHRLSVILMRYALSALLAGKIKTKTQETLDI